jgi:hypothetical protein
VSSERGQSTVEWIGLVFVVATVLAFLVSIAGLAGSGIALAVTVKEKLVCAVGLEDDCGSAEPLLDAYGPDLAAAVIEHAPRLVYEQGMRALPVDYRTCREDPCSMGPEAGEVTASDTGEPVTLFTHAVERGESLYLQYWAYYPGSRTGRLLGDTGYHPDDWESIQLRVRGDDVDARASSHHGYNYSGGVGNWLSDAGVTQRDVWGPAEGAYFISGGSHAGHASDDSDPYRWTPAEAIRIVPLEPIAESDPDVEFVVTPPWLKRVWDDPEYRGTD